MIQFLSKVVIYIIWFGIPFIMLFIEFHSYIPWEYILELSKGLLK